MYACRPLTHICAECQADSHAPEFFSENSWRRAESTARSSEGHCMTNARFCLGVLAVLEILSEKSCRVVACTHIVVGKDVSRHLGFTYKNLECTRTCN